MQASNKTCNARETGQKNHAPSKIDKNNRNARNASVLFQNARCRRNVQVEKRNKLTPPAIEEPNDGTSLCLQVGSEWTVYSSPGILM